jgi:hypothetical protein
MRQTEKNGEVAGNGTIICGNDTFVNTCLAQEELNFCQNGVL